MIAGKNMKLIFSMKEELKLQIKEFNEIKYPKDNSKRIIIATLKPETVTTAPIYNE
jgi:valyl-tRNA synthetase